MIYSELAMTSEVDKGTTNSDTPQAREPIGKGPPKWLIEYGPLLVFLACYRFKDIYFATGAFMIALTVALGGAWLAEGKLPPALIFTAALVLPLGGLTIALRDPRFIYTKPTIVAVVSALILFGGLLRKKALLKSLLGAQLRLSDQGWRALSWRFALFSLLLAAANEAVWRSFTPERERIWVLFKFPGIPLLTAIFLVTQMPLLQRFADGEERSEAAR
jgi:intracellular septation protein